MTIPTSLLHASNDSLSGGLRGFRTLWSLLRRAPLRQTASEPHASRSSPMAAEWLVALTYRGLGHWTTQQHRRITHTQTNFSFSLSLSFCFHNCRMHSDGLGRFFFGFFGFFGFFWNHWERALSTQLRHFLFAVSNLFPTHQDLQFSIWFENPKGWERLASLANFFAFFS